MPKTLLEKDEYRVYVRGPKDGSRYFVSHFNGTVFRRLEVPEEIVSSLLAYAEAVQENIEGILATAKTAKNPKYQETITRR